eukprot:CAMPEP_0118693656 /NCGR_PEP_ID=MMETSP0800-20121206/12039_1 /TAXON_ID=210618 ORGANISM="Striatella unipunctata, Strain CCMP2910" /NCGR_SAMPLE_ID=MMETSP0800 /ASSEMBLY_ACC=CAM_ASM_000638 /LENGTH=232 /DNA_ID=CAMNT_0006591935 /DNA_START=100 /DNA_END=798 /DNA_ORIENTATION=-
MESVLNNGIIATFFKTFLLSTLNGLFSLDIVQNFAFTLEDDCSSSTLDNIIFCNAAKISDSIDLDFLGSAEFELRLDSLEGLGGSDMFNLDFSLSTADEVIDSVMDVTLDISIPDVTLGYYYKAQAFGVGPSGSETETLPGWSATASGKVYGDCDGDESSGIFFEANGFSFGSVEWINKDDVVDMIGIGVLDSVVEDGVDALNDVITDVMNDLIDGLLSPEAHRIVPLPCLF